MAEPGSNVISLNNTSSATLFGEISTFFINQFQSQLFPTLEPAMSSLIDFVIEKTNTASSNTEIMRMMEVQQKLKRSRQAIIDDLKKRLLHNFDEWEQSPKHQPSGSDDIHLSLVETQDIENRLAWQQAAHHIELCEDLQHLFNVESRLQGEIETTHENNPIGAQKICECLALSLSELELDLEVTKELLLHFSRQTKKAIGTIWKEADPFLEELGLELKTSQKAQSTPSEQTSIKTNQESPDKKNSDNSSTDSGTYSGSSTSSFSSEHDEFINSIAQKVVSKVESLLEQPVQGDASSGGVQLAANDLVYALTSIQDQGFLEYKDANANLQQSVRDGLAVRGITKHLSPRHEDLINMVGMLFEFILDDHELPDEVKNLIGLLQIPVLKLALLEKEFLTDRNHPGRCLLNKMTTVGMHCSHSEDPILKLIERTVKTIYKNFIDQPDIFSTCLDSFNRELEQIETSLQEAELFTPEDINSESIGTDSHIQQEDNHFDSTDDENPVDSVITSYRLRHNIPELMDDMVMIGWQQVLETAWQENQSDEDWYHYVNTMDMLLWDIHPERQHEFSPEHWNTLKEHVIQILNDTGLNPLILSGWLQNIDTLTTQRLNFDDEVIVIEQEEVPVISDTKEETDLPNSDEGLILDQEYAPPQPLGDFIPIENLRTGQWVEFIGKNNKQLRCKLARINEETNRYIFVNRSGMKVSEWSGYELEKGIQEQKVRILDNTQFFDKALHAVMDNFLKF